MQILVVAATIEEIDPSRSFLEDSSIPYLITGVGMVATTYALTRHLQKHNVDLLIHVGIGGILDQSACLGEVYQICADEIFGLGADDNGLFIPIEELGFGKRIYAENPPVNMQLPQVNKAKGITVNNVHGATDAIIRLQQHYKKPLIESMEGAAAFFVAEQEKIYCLQFRAISNYIEPRNRDAWKIGLAIKNLNDFLKEFLESLNRSC
ncbi:futalosine hydrolase [Sphingobacterium chuzhouense]|uniref:Futalosine hydrolase n=1 Tax=Sphingobacterium chuzhouense TaxID=1742264 RepID=A0ABR7XPM4_9SPHI|nr:futalosine hydrolase [Sphingobacterium chuzhouense]MBD1421124.1 futalosine hydrolase [Sphingobacterium chuzhouense]